MSRNHDENSWRDDVLANADYGAVLLTGQISLQTMLPTPEQQLKNIEPSAVGSEQEVDAPPDQAGDRCALQQIAATLGFDAFLSPLPWSDKDDSMTPYEVLAEAVADDPNKGFRDVWCDFATWEFVRGYRDDPSAHSKDAVDWVMKLDELFFELNEFDGATKVACQDALEAAFLAFARLDHTDELCNAVRRWREWRLAEQAERDQDKPAKPGDPA